MERRHAYGGGIALAGLVLTVVQVLHGLQQTRRPVVFLFETVPFAVVAAALVFAGYWVAGQPDLEPDLPRIVAWGVGGTVLFASIAALFLFSQRVELGTLQRATYVATDNVTVGAVVGVVVGLYDARSRRRQRELETERDRVRDFAGMAADVNNYGRALNECESLAEVSALCIQAMSTLLGITDVAVVRTDGEGVEVVDNTVNAPEEVFTDVTEQALEREVATVAVHDDVPAEAPDRAERVLTVGLNDGEADVVLVAVASGVDVEDRDVQLLELLFAHAATALSGIETGSVPAGAGRARD